MMRFEKLESAERLDARGALGGIGEFSCCECVLADGDGGVGSLGGLGCREGVVMRLRG